MAYISKRTGEEVDALLDKVERGDFDITIDTELSKESDNAIANSAVTKAIEKKVDSVENKGLSTNDYSNADKALVGSIPTLTTNVDNIGHSLENVEYELNKKADTNGYYPNMSVGVADNLVGRGDVQDATINFRPSGGVLGVGNGMNITDGAARIERIKGNSVAYNQSLVHRNWSGTQNGLTISMANGVVNVSGTATKSGSYAIGTCQTYTTHKILLIGCPHGGSLTSFYISDQANILDFGEGAIGSPTYEESRYFELHIVEGATVDFTFRPRIIDLTKMFGAGNEPTTYKEYLQRKPMNIEDEFAYNEGELIDMKVDSLVSVGDNAWDEEWELGRYDQATGKPITTTASIRGKNVIKVIPNATYYCYSPSYPVSSGNFVYVNFYDDNDNVLPLGNAFWRIVNNSLFEAPNNAAYMRLTLLNVPSYNHDVVIRLSWSGYKNERYYPHQQDVKDLSFIGEAFPEGMRSAGSAFDEIRFNKTTKVWEKIVRVGVRAYAEGDAEDSSVTTDGKTTNYRLDNPTPTTIDLSPNFNLDYLVWDFGTEEAMASVPSAPFRADMNYEPNAVDDLRWAISEIRNLRAELAQLQSSQTSETNLTE